MTALNIFCQPRSRAGYIVADTAVLDAQGAYRESCSKVAISMGRFPYAIGVTGNIHPRALLPIVGAANCKTLKQLIKRLPDILDQAIGSAAKTLGSFAPEVTFKGVAWDFAQKRPVGFQISNNRIVADHEPFQLYEVT